MSSSGSQLSSSTGSVNFHKLLTLPPSSIGASQEFRHTMLPVYESPGRMSQPHLHPEKIDGALWFGIDPSVHCFIKHTWQGNFWLPCKNWSEVYRTNRGKIHSWWGTFVQNYYWRPELEDYVCHFWKEHKWK